MHRDTRTVMKFVCIITLFGAVSAIYPRRDLDLSPVYVSCSSSSDCPSETPCCRHRTTDRLLDDTTGRMWTLPSPAGSGRCSGRRSLEGEECSAGCGCSYDHVCYRTITGMCCPPTTCWKKDEAERDREHWRNCKPPCQFPPSANPGGRGPQLL